MTIEPESIFFSPSKIRFLLEFKDLLTRNNYEKQVYSTNYTDIKGN